MYTVKMPKIRNLWKKIAKAWVPIQRVLLSTGFIITEINNRDLKFSSRLRKMIKNIYKKSKSYIMHASLNLFQEYKI